MNYLKENDSITNKVYQELNNISKPTATRDLAELVALGMLEIDGKGRTLRYLESAHNRLIHFPIQNKVLCQVRWYPLCNLLLDTM